MQAYSDPKRENDPHALPDVETFYHDGRWASGEWCEPYQWSGTCETEDAAPKGWYWRSCFPGCLPDSEPMGPFATEAEALADAQSESEAE